VGSPHGRELEIVSHISMREAVGYSLGEIADLCEHERESFRHVSIPADRPIGKAWVSARLRDLRQDIRESGAAT
jgi:hypothetical protein